MSLFGKQLWPHQEKAIRAFWDAVQQGQRRICITVPTGGGKTLIMAYLAAEWMQSGRHVHIYTNRLALLDQLSAIFNASHMPHGWLASGQRRDCHLPLQIRSIQSEFSRIRKAVVHDGVMPERCLAIIDEAHLNRESMTRAIMDHVLRADGCVVGFTATPLGLDGLYDVLVQPASMSELRSIRAVVPAVHFGPDEPDPRKWKGLGEDELPTERQAAKAMNLRKVFGRIWTWYNILNPKKLPCIVFAPGVPESIWIAQQFACRGVPSAHVDGKSVWIDGRLLPVSSSLRQEVLERSRQGAVQVLSNRFVLREGIDLPHLSHAILATVFSSMQSYLQACGRVLRAAAGKEQVVIQDHGGNWHRYGSLNVDRNWSLQQDDYVCTMIHRERLRKAPESQPWSCPRCARINVGSTCAGCGYVVTSLRTPRPVLSTNGELVHLDGPVYKQRPVFREPSGPALWRRMYFRSLTPRGRKTFRQAAALFAAENNWKWPDPSWPLMPKKEIHWFFYVDQVPKEELT